MGDGSAQQAVVRRLPSQQKEAPIGLDDLAKKADDALGSDKIEKISGKAHDAAATVAKKAGDALGSEKVEKISDKALDAAATAAKKVTGGKYDAKIDSARDAVDGKLGSD